MNTLIADSGATKCSWILLSAGSEPVSFTTQGIAPYLMNDGDINQVIASMEAELLEEAPEQVFYYGTGMANENNAARLTQLLKSRFPGAEVQTDTDLLAAARGLCGRSPGIACILGTGSNTGYYDGHKIAANSPGIGYILGDEGSGVYIGKKIIQYYLYNTFDEELKYKFERTYQTNAAEIIDNVYRKPLPNRYIASFAKFAGEHQDHYMIGNIIEDSLNEFFFNHICKFDESWSLPIHFTGSIAFVFQKVILQLCADYNLEAGQITRSPAEGLIVYHKSVS